jgi:hypothetical protein
VGVRPGVADRDPVHEVQRLATREAGVLEHALIEVVQRVVEAVVRREQIHNRVNAARASSRRLLYPNMDRLVKPDSWRRETPTLSTVEWMSGGIHPWLYSA